MSGETIGEPSLVHTYKGFAAPRAPKPATRTPAWRSRRAAILAGSALGLGLLFGLLARPELAVDRPPPAPMQPVAVADLSGQMEIEFNPPPAPPLPQDGGKLEVLPADMAAAAPKAPAWSATYEPPPRPIPTPKLDPVLPPQSAPTPAPQAVRPSFECRFARTPAEVMVCRDAALAAADRRMARAFRRATDAGVPYAELRGEQDDWLAVREDAARRSRGAVASIYDQRIEELEAMARGDPYF
ncbi:MAG: hypothetical protein ACK41C_07530 [Phenylobacterium sp.]|uniref:hypothetical protein n=1 Tax=Phenylobacterium sp. TaxID=1871053 RepID=UPI00391D68C8